MISDLFRLLLFKVRFFCRLQDAQALLLCAEHLGSRNLRAGQLLARELEEFRNSTLAVSVLKHQCRLILQKFKYIAKHQDSTYVVPLIAFQNAFKNARNQDMLDDGCYLVAAEASVHDFSVFLWVAFFAFNWYTLL
jgi:hypothetical protein